MSQERDAGNSGNDGPQCNHHHTANKQGPEGRVRGAGGFTASRPSSYLLSLLGSGSSDIDGRKKFRSLRWLADGQEARETRQLGKEGWNRRKNCVGDSSERTLTVAVVAKGKQPGGLQRGKIERRLMKRLGW